MLYPQEFDVIVVGGGHAGTEAALASARMGCKTLLLSHNIETLGQMSCNPSIGGIGKGHLVKEVDALGGAMALATDEAGIQFRILNSSKGPAVRATRAQADRLLYKAAIRRLLENQPNLWLFQQAVDDLMVEGDRVVGAVTQVGIRFRARTVVLTAGTVLDGKIHVGLQNYAAGRAGDPPAVSLSARLKELKLPQGRLKTGTPPRLDGRTIDFSKCTEQPGDGMPGGMGARIRHAHPSAIDDLAADFPNLKIIMAHPGWPWVDETTAVALHKGNVYWEMSGWAPKYFPGNLKVDMRTRLQDKIMFGSDYPSMPYERILREWGELGYKDEVMEKIMHGNAQRVLGL